MDERTDSPYDAVAEAGVISDLARRASTPHALDPSKPHSMLVREGEGVETIDLESFLPAPRRSAGIYSPADADSFVNYATLHRSGEQTTVWVDQLNARIVAVLNDNGATGPGWGDHRAVLALIKTPEWQHWLSADGKYLNQEQFAEHLQDGIMEIREPAAAEVLEVAQTIQGKTNADWKSATRLDNGAVGFSYQEEVVASAGRSGNLEIPAEIVLGVAPFYGEQPFEVRARLRYKIREGNLAIGYKLERPNEIELEVLKAISERLRGEAGFEQVYMGEAPA
jgi:uncharacterized protein YfdQ (DUF2303 family)